MSEEVKLPAGFEADERGNVWLTYDGAHNAWIRLDGDVRLEITVRPDNYPGLTVRTARVTDRELATHILTHLEGFRVRKLNLDDPRLDGVGAAVPGADQEEADDPAGQPGGG